MDKNNIAVGDLVKIDLAKCKKYHSYHPNWLSLVKKAIKNAENGMPYVSWINDNDTIDIRAWEMDILGDATIPVDAIISVTKGDSK